MIPQNKQPIPLHHKQFVKKNTYSNVPTAGFEDIETLFGLKARVKKGTISFQEIEMLQNLNRLLFAVGFDKVLSIPSNFEILSALRNSQKKPYFICHKNEELNKENYQKSAVVAAQESPLKKGSDKENSEEEKSNDSGKKRKRQTQSQKIEYSRKNDHQKQEETLNVLSQESNTFYNINSFRLQHQFLQNEQENSQSLEQENLQSSLQEIQEYINLDFSSSLKPQQKQLFPCEFPQPSGIIPTHGWKFSKLKGWFFVDRSQEISNAHSLQTSVSEKSYWNILSTIWAQISVIKNKELCKQYNITEAARNQEQRTLKSTQAYHNKCHLWMSETPYFLSTTLNETVQPSTINSQTAIYEPFDLRVIFTEDDSTNCLRSLIFGLLFNALAFQKSNNIVQQLVSSDVSITIKLVLFHIIEMQYQKKLTQRELAMNLSLLFRFNHFSGQLLSIFSSQLPGIFNTEKLIQDFAAKFNCSVVLQNVSPFGSTTKMVNPSQQIGNIIFLDITSKECALNLYYQEEKQNSCMNVYIEKLGKNFTLPSI